MGTAGDHPRCGRRLRAGAVRVRPQAVRRLEGQRHRQAAVVFVVRRVELGAAGDHPRCCQRNGANIKRVRATSCTPPGGAATSTSSCIVVGRSTGASWAPQAANPGVASAMRKALARSATSCTPPGRAAAPTSSCACTPFDGSSWAQQTTMPDEASEIGPTLRLGNSRTALFVYAAWKGSDDYDQLNGRQLSFIVV